MNAVQLDQLSDTDLADLLESACKRLRENAVKRVKPKRHCAPVMPVGPVDEVAAEAARKILLKHGYVER